MAGIIIVVTIVIFMIFKNKKDQTAFYIADRNKEISVRSKEKISKAEFYEMSIKFENLPALTEEQESRLVEVKDSKLLSKIDGVVPGTLQAIANTCTVKEYVDATKSAGQLYRVIIPQGAVLDKSRNMPDAFRSTYREAANRIKGQANWIAVDNSAANNLAKLNVANAVMGVAAMVVGQYYMKQINEQLEDINAGIEKIADFQSNEFKSKVYALVADIQKSSTFQIETVENDELRNRELSHLKSLEHECAQLLGQINLALQGITSNKNLKYDKYEKLIYEAETWYQYQRILLEVMYKISDLSYALNLGAISRENSYALYLPYAKQSEGALEKLNAWHIENGKELEINIDENRRKRQGVERFLMGALGIFKDDFNYKKVPNRTIDLIKHQTDSCVLNLPVAKEDLFQEDVRLIAKEGKLYYLPEVE